VTGAGEQPGAHVELDALGVELGALDIHGPSVPHAERLSDRVRSAVQAVSTSGIQVVVSTGRSLHSVLPILDRLGLQDGYAVCSNGAVVLRLDPRLPCRYEIVHTETFNPAAVLKLLRDRLPTALYALEVVGEGYRLTAPFPPGELPDPFEIVPFDVLLDVPATRVIVRSLDHTTQEFLDLTEQLGLHEVSYAVGWTAWLDLAPDGVSKASALEIVRRRLGVAASRTLAVGDGRNDLEMFAWAARAVAMGQSAPDVLGAADEVTATVWADGLALVLEPLIGGS
jgi:hydroxymethylpyrimidine pyrophosphatase-like HAD family hydrolase